MGDSRGHLSNGDHPIGPLDLFFHLFDLGDVLKDQNRSNWNTVEVLELRSREPEVDSDPIGFFKGDFLPLTNPFPVCRFDWHACLEIRQKRIKYWERLCRRINSENSIGRSVHEGDSPGPVCGDQATVKTLDDVLVKSL